MIISRLKPNIPFVVAEDKLDDFLKAKTATASEVVANSKAHRKKLMERARKCTTNTLLK